MFNEIGINEMLELREQGKMNLIDVRSPSEFKEASIPGSYNIPLFTDEERAEIGILYKQVSPEAAQEKGLEVVSAKLPAFIGQFRDIPGEKTVFCWRGGMRSKTAATVLDLMNIHVHRLQGGIRAYRKWIVDKMEHMEFHPPAYVLNGNTGTGKTVILRKLQEEGYPVVDLEGMANHRGSIFGQVGLEPHNQKTFDALLYERLHQLQDAPFVMFEGESRRIGRVVLPEFVNDLKNGGIQIFLDMPMEERIQHILDDYRPWEYKEECLEAFGRIKTRIHTPVAKEIGQSLQEEDFSKAVRLLLEYYYDPRYEHSADQYDEEKRIILKVANAEEAIEKIVGLLPKLSLSH